MTRQSLLIHAVGGGDCGFAAASRFTDCDPDYEGDPAAIGTNLRPLRKVFQGLTLANEKIENVTLLGTTNEHRPGDRPFLAYAREMAARLTGPAGLCGRRLEPTCVSAVPVSHPTMEAAGRAVTRLLIEQEPVGCLVTCGSGAYALSVGALLAAVEVGIPVRLVHIDRADRPYEIATERHARHHLTRWLVRHRFWDELAQLDPDHRHVWALLAARQRADCSLARQLTRGTGTPKLEPGKITKLTELWPTVRAAFLERLGRGEAVDYSLLRAWFWERLSREYRKEQGELPAGVPLPVVELLERGLDGSQDGASKVRAASEALPVGTTSSRVVRMIRDPKLIEMLSSASTHNAHLHPYRHRPLPHTLIEEADRFERDDVARELVSTAGHTARPVLGSGDVLVLMGLGLPRDGLEEDDRHALKAVLEQARIRRDQLLRRGRIRLRLLASDEAAPRAGTLLSWAQPLLDTAHGEAEVIPSLPVGPEHIDQLRRQVTAHLQAGPQPTGMSGSGCLRDVDDVLLVLNPGTAAADYGMIAAGIDWALEVACPFTLTELARRPGLPPELRAGRPTLCRLGMDGVLAHLAAGALRRLDLRTVTHLLSLGSSALAIVLEHAHRFTAQVWADPGYAVTASDRDRLAHARLGLVTHVLGDHPELAAYTAVECVRPSLFTFARWQQQTRKTPAARTLTRIRDASPFCHLLDRRRAGQGGRPRGGRADVRSLLREVMDRLPDSGGHLVAEYERLLTRVEALSPYTGRVPHSTT